MIEARFLRSISLGRRVSSILGWSKGTVDGPAGAVVVEEIHGLDGAAGVIVDGFGIGVAEGTCVANGVGGPESAVDRAVKGCEGCV